MNDTPNGKQLPVLASRLRKVLEWLCRRITEVLNIPPWLLSFLIPKSDQIWVFGSWFSEKYSDNPKWLYEYMTKHVPEVRAIWDMLRHVFIKPLRVITVFLTEPASKNPYLVTLWNQKRK